MKVNYYIKPRAQQDIVEIIRYIYLDNSSAAERFFSSVLRTAELVLVTPRGYSLVQFSNLMPTSNALRHRPVVNFPKYEFYYSIKSPSVIEVVRILHGSRNSKKLL